MDRLQFLFLYHEGFAILCKISTKLSWIVSIILGKVLNNTRIIFSFVKENKKISWNPKKA